MSTCLLIKLSQNLKRRYDVLMDRSVKIPVRMDVALCSLADSSNVSK